MNEQVQKTVYGRTVTVSKQNAQLIDLLDYIYETMPAAGQPGTDATKIADKLSEIIYGGHDGV